MTFIDLLNELKSSGCKLSVENDQLRVKGKLSDQLRSQILLHKQALISFLSPRKKPILLRSIRKEGELYEVHSTQRGLWLASQQDGAESTYVEPGYRYYLKGTLDVSLLERAFGYLINRHEIIRTTYHFDDGKLFQRVEPNESFSIVVDDIRDIDVKEHQEAENQILKFEATKAFDLAEDLMLRVRLIRYSDDEYMLLMVMHHIAMDGWSWRVIARELNEVYNGLLNGNQAPLEPMEFQYGDYVDWRRSTGFDQQITKSLEYWSNQLESAPVVHQLPLDYPRPSLMSYESDRYSLTLSREQTDSLKKLARAHGVTLYTVLNSLFSLVISRYSGEKDIVVGSPYAGRSHLDFESMVGFFVNTLALRISWKGDPVFLDFLENVHQTTKQAELHQNAPFESVVDYLETSRSNSYSPIFQIMLVLLNMDAPDLELNSLEQIDVGQPFYSKTKYDLSLICFEERENLKLCFEYNTSLFKSKTIEHLAQSVMHAINSILDNPTRKISEVNLFDSDERRQMLNINSGESIFDGWCLHDKFEKQVLLTPDNIAVKHNDIRITYDELNEQSNTLAHYLRKAGVKEGVPIGICLDRTPSIIVAVIAVLKTGCYYVSIDPTYPEERLNHILKDSKCGVLITEGKYLKHLEYPECDVHNIDNYWREESQKNDISLPCDPSQLSHLIYTSGSTGTPKGVMIEHRNVASLMDWTFNNYQSSELASTLFSTSLNFDLSVFELWAPLLSGGTVVIVRDILELTERDDVFPSLINTVPSAIDALVAANAIPNTVVTFNVAGEPLSQKRVNSIFLTSKVKAIYNLYGPSEDTTYSTFSKMENPVKRDPTIGKPISHTNTYILDNDLALVPNGVVGELYLSGSGVSRGYWNRDVLTERSFIPNPYGSIGHETLYRTGDMVSLVDGELVYMGRQDNQVKIRGFRVELGEIESLLNQIEYITEQAVIYDEHIGGLIGCIVMDPTVPQADVEIAIRELLLKELPGYMIPQHYHFLKSLPLTSNGKLDRTSLKSQLIIDSVDDSSIKLSQPKNLIEEQLLTLWKSVLTFEKLGVNSNFFKSGGDSILAIQLVAKARKDGFNMTSSFVFNNQTVLEQAKNIPRFDVDTSLAVVAAEGEQLFTPMMAAFFDDDEYVAEQYNQSMLFEVPSLTLVQWHNIIGMMWHHHDVFRLAFDLGTKVATYKTSKINNVNASVYEIDVKGLEANKASKLIQEKANKLQSSFSLSLGNLNACLIVRSDEGDQLIWFIHHLIVDGVSWRVLEQDLKSLYRSAENNQHLTLESSGNSLQKYARYLHSEECLNKHKNEIRYWQSELNVTATIPNNLGSLASADESTTSFVAVTLPIAETAQLLTTANEPYNTRPNELMIAALNLVLMDWSDSSEFRLELEGHGRDDNAFNIEQSLGWFTSLYPVSFSKVSSTEQYIIGVKEKLRSIPANGLGYGVLLQTHRIHELYDNATGADVVFNYLGQFSDDIGKLNSFLAGEHISRNRRRNHKLGINALVENKKLTIRFDYSTKQFSKSAIQERVEQFLSELRSIIGHCQNADRVLTPTDFPLSTLSTDAFYSVISEVRGLSDLYPVTPAQHGMLLHSSVRPESPVYNNLVVLSFAEMNEDRFKRSLNVLVTRHSILRTQFVSLESSDVHQAVYDESLLRCKCFDWSYESDPTNQLSTWIQQESTSPFSTDSAPLMRFTLIKFSDHDWRFVWKYHHSVLDGWSIALLIEELKAIYIDPDAMDLEPDNTSFRQFVEWQQSQDLSSAQDYWSDRLGGVLEPTRFQNDASRQNGQTKKKLSVGQAIGKPLTEEINAFAANHGITVSVFIQAAWGILLSKYSNSTDVVFGQTVSGRTAPIENVDKIVGPCLTTIPVRYTFPGDDVTFTDWLKAVQLHSIQDESNGYAGLPKIQSWSQVKGPMFDSLIVFENYPKGSMDSNGCGQNELCILGLKAYEENDFPVSLIIIPGSDLQFNLDVDTAYLSSSQTKSILFHLVNLMQSMLKNENNPLSALTLTSPDGQNIVMDATVKAQITECIHSKFEVASKQYPNKIALVCEQDTFTYKALNRRANRFARELIGRGVRVEDLVGLHTSRSVDLVVGIIAILKAGGAYVPLDPSLPNQRLQYIAEDAKLSWIVSNGDFEGQENVIQISHYEDDEEDDINPVVSGLTPEKLAYVIYTSGSTGNPKGVMVEHRNVVRLFTSSSDHFMFNENDVWTLFHSYAFDFSVWEFWGALAYGGKLVVVSHEQSRSPTLYFDAIRQHGVTVLNQTPSAFYSLSKVIVQSGQDTSLKYVIFGGEALDFGALKPWFNHFGDTQPLLVNMYGITETTVHVTYQAISKEQCELSTSIVGVPLSDLRTLVCDEHLNVLPSGVPGELIVCGDGVARGYLNRPELTKTSFIVPPVYNNLRAYRSGDLVCQQYDGSLEYLGRIDQQVKIRGYRIELAEIESCIRQHVEVGQAVVFVNKTELGHKQLVAYIERKDEQSGEFDERGLRGFLSKRLPDYMVPALIHLVPYIPLTNNGKVDYRILSSMEISKSARTIILPQNEEEQVLMDVAEQVLNQTNISMDDSFFSVGGDSIIALQFVSELSDKGFNISASDVFAANYFTEMVKRMDKVESTILLEEYHPFCLLTGQKKPDLIKHLDNVEDAYPAVLMQEAMLTTHNASGVLGHYLDVFSFKVSAPWVADKFKVALKKVMQRHELLRTGFWLDPAEGQYIQIVYSEAEPLVTVSDWQYMSQDKIQSKTRELIETERDKGLDFGSKTLLRIHVAILSDDTFSFTLTFSHAILDGWSVSILNKELCEIYRALLDKVLPNRMPSPLPYHVYVKKELESRGDVLQEAFWQSQLNEAVVTTLPSSGGKKRKISHFNHKLTDLLPKLQSIAFQLNIPLQHVLLAGHIKVLALMSGESDILTGVVSNCRPELSLSDQSLGLFLNTLPIRSIVSNTTWLDLASDISEIATNCFANRFYPLADIQQRTGLQVNQVLYNFTHFQDYGQEDEQGNVALSFLDKHEASEFAWVMQFMLTAEEGLVLEIQGNDTEQDVDYAQKLEACYEAVFKSMAEQPTSSHVGVYDEIIASQQSFITNGIELDIIDAESLVPLHHQIEEQVRQFPHNTAAICQDNKLTYLELNHCANVYAQQLHASGISEGSVVGVLLDRSLDLLVALLAILKTGAAYIPLDPSFPEVRIQGVLEDASCSLLVVNNNVRHRVGKLLSKTNVAVSFIDRDYSSSIPTNGMQYHSSSVSMTSPAYVIYTSGSTGKPKGVVIEQKALSNFISASQARFQTNENSHTLALTTISFDIAVLELFLPLVSGATCVIASDEEKLQGAAVQRLIIDHDIQFMQATPTGYQFLLDSEEWVGKPSMQLLCGGEALPVALARKLLQTEGHLWNQYGPTEATVWVTAAKVSEADLSSENGYIAISGLLANCKAAVLNEMGEMVPVGVPGELYLAGANLARGYYNRQSLTEASFVFKTIHGSCDKRWYRTGDLVRLESTGQLTYLSRRDHQVKIRGYRIELGEIESVINQYIGVQTCTVVADQSRGDTKLAAYVVMDAVSQSHESYIGELKGYIKSQLPSYMVPANIISIEKMPLTPNGKVDRKQLPVECDDHKQSRKAFTSENQRQLSLMWQELLGLKEQPHAESDFFELGGHSLLAMRLAVRIRAKFGIDMSIQSIFSLRSIEKMATDLEAGTLSDKPALEKVGDSLDKFASYAQQRIWFIEQLPNGKGSYNMPMQIALRGELDSDRLKQAIINRVERFTSLRTVFHQTDSGLLTNTLPTNEFNFEIEDLSSFEALEKQKIVEQQWAQVAEKPFELSSECLLRAKLLILGNNEFRLLLTMHHIISDGWSWGNFLHEINLDYNGRNALPSLKYDMSDFSAVQQQWVESKQEPLREFWTDYLKGVPALHSINTDFPRPVNQEYQGHNYHFRLSGQLTDKLNQMCNKHNVTMFMVLQSAFSLLLSRYSGESDIVMGTPMAGREYEELEAQIGLFVNTLVMRTDLSQDPTVSELLSRCKTNVTALMAHQDVPFEWLVDTLRPERSTSYSPLFQVMFALQSMRSESLSLAHTIAEEVKANTGRSRYDLSLYCKEEDGEIGALIEYATSLFNESTIEAMSEHLETLLWSMVDAENAPVSTLPMLSLDAQHEILSRWNDTNKAYDTKHLIHELFEQKVAEAPNAPAVVFRDESLTYEQLNNRVNRLANYLVDNRSGEPKDQLVGVCLPRSLDMVISLMAILKAGMAYVPIDPSYPASRISYMLSDSKVSLVLTHSGVLEQDMNREDIYLDTRSVQELLASQPVTRPNVFADLNDLCYVIYTSGSTGNPKGVMVEHGAILNRLMWMQDTYNLQATDKILQKTPFSFDVSVWEFFWPLMYGASLVVAKPEGHKDSAYLAELIISQSISVVHFVPSMLQLFVEEPQLSECHTLRYVFCSGEALPYELEQRFFALNNTAELHNLYGPTEAAVDVTWWRCDRYGTKKQVPIGRPIANMQTVILDKRLMPVPVNVPGELYLSGVGLARGYLNKPELTELAFITNPFSENTRLYKTGDKVRWLPDGTIEYLGRLDHQIKLRGFRIELGEIESTICGFDAVREAVALLDSTMSSPSLIAYVVPNKGEAINVDSMRANLRSRLPEHLVPSYFVVTDKMPLTPNGKLDRKALPKPQIKAETRIRLPETKMEVWICDIWETLLLQKVSTELSFFSAGGNSLLALRVISQVKQRYPNLPVTVQEVFENQTIQSFSAIIDKRLKELGDMAEVIDDEVVDGDEDILIMDEEF